MFTCLAIASAITLTPVQKPASRTVAFYDRAIHLSQRVLDRTICPDIVRIYPIKDRSEFLDDFQFEAHVRAMHNLRQRNSNSQYDHCKSRLRTEGLNETECALNEGNTRR